MLDNEDVEAKRKCVMSKKSMLFGGGQMGIIGKLFKKDVDELSDAGWFLKAHSLWHHEKGNFYKPKEALKYLDQAIKLNPNKGEAYGSRGIAYFQLRNYHLSVENHTQAIKTDPEYIMNYINRAHAYFQLGMYEKAIEDTTQATELDPNATVSYAVRAGFYSQLEKHDLVIKEYDQIIRLEPNNAAYYYARGWNYAVKLDDHQKAIEDYNQAIRLEPNQTLLYIARGKSYLILKDFVQMCRDYKKACDLGDCESLQMAKKQGYCL